MAQARVKPALSLTPFGLPPPPRPTGRWIDANTFTTGPYASCCDCCATVFTVSPPEQAGGPVTIVVDGTRLHKAPDITQGMQMVAQLQAMLAMQQPHAAPGQMQLQMQMAGGGQQDMLASWMAASGAAGASAPPYTAIPPMSK